MSEITINLSAKKRLGADISTPEYDISLTQTQQIGADVSPQQIGVDFGEQIKTVVMPYSHDQLDNLDYESSGHTGFASTKFVEEHAVPFRLASLPSTTGFRQGASIYVDDGKKGFRMSMTDLKDLNTKIITTENVDNVDMSKLTIDDFIYERKK